MPNPSPKKEYLCHKRDDDTKYPLAEKALSVRVGTEIDSAVRALPNRAAWLREVITEAAKSQGLVQS